jgi:hypothetical protein
MRYDKSSIQTLSLPLPQITHHSMFENSHCSVRYNMAALSVALLYAGLFVNWTGCALGEVFILCKLYYLWL